MDDFKRKQLALTERKRKFRENIVFNNLRKLLGVEDKTSKRVVIEKAANEIIKLRQEIQELMDSCTEHIEGIENTEHTTIDTYTDHFF